ncbi:quinone oxidoreductase, partial [Mesorhizobium sp. M8A.F.Ca.ET.213.01.1.1]|uniref:zinc-binding dehydrogenase n=1 Tax=Mesorhizobium sp. M8A.F.Ca.ET.213.01.1.1 TaxID=2563970 RepID=UPI001139680B
ARREDVVAMSEELFSVVLSGAVEIKINQRYALKDAGRAHSDLEGRRTTGTTVLIP